MYAVLYTTEGRDEDEHLYEDVANKISAHVYYCKSKELAIKYVISRFLRIYNSIKNNPRYRITRVSSKPNKNGILINIKGSNIKKKSSWEDSCIEYEYADGAEYPYFTHRFRIIRAQEIIIGKNGPTLHAE